jgi:hypothetical protein
VACGNALECSFFNPPDPEAHVLGTLIAILLVLWLLGMVTSYTAGGLLHILLVIAVVVFIVRMVQGRRVV